ncbi:MAG: hypothetical protein KGJ29_15415, partial [Hyphomicrobiales bacterium]|nr:hypothetical protein [Hyphomicrobiales bacterium]
LSYLYEHCLFTVYPSIVEGWGLPIGESLAHGKLCIASNTSSMPEVGGEFVQYLDPFNFTGAFDIVSRFINNPIEVREAEMRIKLGFRPRSWNEVVKTMGASIDAVTKPAVSATETRCTLPKAKIILFGTNQQARRKIADFREFTYPLACVDGWDQPEYWGRWALSRMPKVRFTLDGITGRRKLRVALRFQLPSPTARVEVILSSGALQDTVTMKDGLPRWYFINAEADEFGVVDIKFHIKGDIQKVDPVRFLTVGILAMAVVEIDNLNDRMLMMESIRSYR